MSVTDGICSRCDGWHGPEEVCEERNKSWRAVMDQVHAAYLKFNEQPSPNPALRELLSQFRAALRAGTYNV